MMETLSDLAAHAVAFEKMPAKTLMTLALETPPAWLAFPIQSIHDLDNIRLADVSNGDVSVIYELENIIVEGHCRDTVTGAPPRGLQLELSAAGNNPKVDSL